MKAGDTNKAHETTSESQGTDDKRQVQNEENKAWKELEQDDAELGKATFSLENNCEEEMVSLAQQFIKLGLNPDVEILDVACGTGVVTEECIEAGYKKIDGLDPCQGYLDGGLAKGIFRKVYREFIDADTKTTI